ncbi:MAG: TPD domain-containing protein [Candidatus Micrarchaeota archaeon]
MVVVSKDEFDFIYSRLNSPNDIDLLHERMSLPKDMLINVLAKKITRRTTRDFYRVKDSAKYYLGVWKKGKTICQIADHIRFSPVLLSGFLFGDKMSKKSWRDILKDPSLAKGARLQKEVKEAVTADFVYSPRSNEQQSKNGKRSEGGIEKWLDEHKIKYITEYDRKAELEPGAVKVRTPDFLLDKPVIYKGKKVFWFESKSSFGDHREAGRDFKKQLEPYTKLFGPGVVCYWYGYVREVELPGVMLTTKEDFGVTHEEKSGVKQEIKHEHNSEAKHEHKTEVKSEHKTEARHEAKHEHKS